MTISGSERGSKPRHNTRIPLLLFQVMAPGKGAEWGLSGLGSGSVSVIGLRTAVPDVRISS
jgi:hypothetical protein